MKESTSLASQVPADLSKKLEQIASNEHMSLEDVIAHLLEKILVHKERQLPEATKQPHRSKNDNS